MGVSKTVEQVTTLKPIYVTACDSSVGDSLGRGKGLHLPCQTFTVNSCSPLPNVQPHRVCPIHCVISVCSSTDCGVSAITTMPYSYR